MSRIPLKYPMLICRGTDTHTHRHTDGRKIFTQYSGISSCSRGSTYAGYGFPRKKGTFFGEGERGRFAQKKGVTLASSTGYIFPRKKNPPQAQTKYSHSEYFDPPTYIGI